MSPTTATEAGTPLVCNNVVNKNANVWHHRLGHLYDNILYILRHKYHISIPKQYSGDTCHVCPISKFKRLPFISNNHFSNEPFDLVHCDVWGSFHQATHDGKRYFLTTMDDCSRFSWIHLMKQKSEATQLLKKFVAFAQTQFNRTIKAIRSDNAKELALTEFLQELGIHHQFPCPHRPQQNSVVERKHQHILNVAKALLFQAGMPLKF